MKGRIRIIIVCLFCCILSGNQKSEAQILKDTASLNLLKKGVDFVYNFQFSNAEDIYTRLSKAYPNHHVIHLFRGMITYWENYPLIPTSHSCAVFEESMKKCIDLCTKKNTHDEAETLLSNLCARGFLLLFYTDNNMSLDVFPLATSTYPLIRRAFNYTDSYPDFYFFTGLYNYYREAYPDNYPVYKPLTFLFPKGDKLRGLKEISLASKNAIVLKAESFSFLSSIFLGFENDYQKALYYIQSRYEIYPGNPQSMAEYIKNLLLLKQYDKAEEILKSGGVKSENQYFQAQTYVFNGILLEKKYHDNIQAEINYNKGVRAISMFSEFGNEYKAYAYFGLSRISDDSGDKHYKRTYRKLAQKLAPYKKITFDN
jgi:hypothetical protein